MNKIKLSAEQENFISLSLKGHNILVDACIGSGKTTAIQHLCNALPQNLNILYLTYSKLLKFDAQAKIHNKNVTVTNYHGLAASLNSTKVGVSMLVKEFNSRPPNFKPFDVLIIDEYQDIEQELKEMLYIIHSKNKSMQIIAVGDMEQKIFDKTTLDVSGFMHEFLGQYTKLTFTKCFRINAEHAKMLGNIWNKKIIGTNELCEIITMAKDDAVSFLAECNPKDILCLGANKGLRLTIQNELEEIFPQKYNKLTVYSSISEEDSGGAKPSEGAAIFTTFDSSKGLERKICVVCDFTESYWQIRMGKANQKYEILRNMFCVAASRGKEKIIFVYGDEGAISKEILSTHLETNTDFEDVNISKMFEHKYREDIDECYELLSCTKLDKSNNSLEINIHSLDGYIDLTPCIGVYQEAVFFQQYNIDKAVEAKIKSDKDLKYLWEAYTALTSLDEKILFFTSLETTQNRYRWQVGKPFVNEVSKVALQNRLAEIMSPNEEVQVYCDIHFKNPKNNKRFSAVGLADVVKDNKVYELKFVSELVPEHFLQCACYMAALNLEVGILWNTRNNDMYEIRIPNKKLFLDAVTKTITKGMIQTHAEPDYYKPNLDDSHITLTSFDKDTLEFKTFRERGVVLKDYEQLRHHLDTGDIFALQDFTVWEVDGKIVNILMSDTGRLLYSTSKGIKEDLKLITAIFRWQTREKPLPVTFITKDTGGKSPMHKIKLIK